MKSIKIIVISLLVVTILGCSQKEKEYTILSGTIDNATDNDLIISAFIGNPIDTIMIHSETGKFRDTLHLTEGKYYINNGLKGTWVYLAKGNEVTIQVDIDDFFASIECTKDDTGINQYLITKNRHRGDLLQKYKPYFNVAEQEYKTAINNIRKAKDSLLLTMGDLPETYRNKEQRNIYYEYLDRLKDYERYAFKKNKVSPDFFSELHHENLDSIHTKDYFFSIAYRKLILWDIERKARELVEKEAIDIQLATIKTINQVQDQQVKNSLVYRKAIIEKGMVSTKNHKEYYTVFKEASSNAKDIQKVTILYKQLKKIQKGNLSPTFYNYEDYEGGAVSLEDLKGKYVYLDIWATWCMPCVKEVPHLKKIIKQYDGKDITFVSISLDKRKDYEKWRAMIKEEAMTGIQLFADDAFNSKFAIDYSIVSIPRFILLDPEGEIINNNAPRPSDPELVALFDTNNI
ncbi:TlpA family protein disulfide reductase [Aquimarina aquimarini]|uniref:TlpA family protein disulfide reductase n=1 Tax=Aquimarina aquimarini TaxID=1191734 RepID=UPI000D54EB36|nr:TlpA disulfide reductase family protein [Aquimarina aquimarini]